MSITLDEQQLKAVNSSARHCLVTGVAGTGKTETLKARAQHLLSQGVPAESIVIISYDAGKLFLDWCKDIVTRFDDYFGIKDYTLLEGRDLDFTIELVQSIACTGLGWRYIEFYEDSLKTGSELDMEVSDNPSYYSFMKEFNQYKKENKCYTETDLYQIIAKSLYEDEALRAKVSAQYQHILVDEIEEVNSLEYSLLDVLAKSSHLFCVGDSAESIMPFKGADYTSIDLFTHRFPGTEVVRLTTNYRQSQEMVDYSNWFMGLSDTVVAAKGSGERTRLVYFEDADEIKLLIHNIKRHMSEGDSHFSDHMIMARHWYDFRGLRKILKKNGIAAVSGDYEPVCERESIELLLYPLRIIADWRDKYAWIGYIHESYKIKSHLTNWSLQDAGKLAIKLSNCNDLDTALEEFANQDNIPPIATVTLYNVYRCVSNVPAAIKAARHFMEHNDSNDYDLIERIAPEYQNISHFLAEFKMHPSLAKSIDSDAVRLTTIHSAKGKEAKHCYVLNADVGLCPSQGTYREGSEEVASERRVLYVALTRASQTLTVYRRWGYVGRDYLPARDFFKDAPEGLATIENL